MNDDRVYYEWKFIPYDYVHGGLYIPIQRIKMEYPPDYKVNNYESK